jgi:hypothetical protein
MLSVCAGDFDLNEWVQNCLQLSGCFLECNTFALSKHCCAAVEALILQQHQQQQQKQHQQEASDASCASSQDTDTASQLLQQQADQQDPSTSKDQSDSKDQASKQQQPQKEPASKLQHQQQQQDECTPGGPTAPLLSALLAVLDADVAANVCLAFAKLHLYNLVASHEAVLEGKQVQPAFSTAAQVPAVLSFDALPGLPALASLPWGPAAMARTYDEALLLFKAALPWFKRALEHYQLDGWVTEHCNILFEMSNLYRWAAGGVLQG